MNDTTSTIHNDGAQMGGNALATATNQNTLSITETQRENFLTALYAMRFANFKKLFDSQPVAFAALGIHLQHSKDKGECLAVSSFIDAIRNVNLFAFDLMQNRAVYDDMIKLVNSLPLIEETEE